MGLHHSLNATIARSASVAVLFFALCLVCGCAQSNIIQLAYPDRAATAAPASKKSRVCVVDFENKRESGAIGVRQSGKQLLPRTPVERWLASSMAEELVRAGYETVLAETMEDALAANADYIVEGEALEVWLAETSHTRFTGSVRLSIALFDGHGAYITKNSYSSVYSKTVLPIYGVPQTLLNEALAEILQPAVQLLSQVAQ